MTDIDEIINKMTCIKVESNLDRVKRFIHLIESNGLDDSVLFEMKTLNELILSKILIDYCNERETVIKNYLMASLAVDYYPKELITNSLAAYKIINDIYDPV
jgi:hypothetical protein